MVAAKEQPAPTRVNLQLAQERAPSVQFMATREHAQAVELP